MVLCHSSAVKSVRQPSILIVSKLRKQHLTRWETARTGAGDVILVDTVLSSYEQQSKGMKCVVDLLHTELELMTNIMLGTTMPKPTTTNISSTIYAAQSSAKANNAQLVTNPKVVSSTTVPGRTRSQAKANNPVATSHTEAASIETESNYDIILEAAETHDKKWF